MKIGPRYKIARRLGADIFEKTQTQKYALRETRKSSKKQRSKTDYGIQFNDKQRVRFTYGVSEKQFSNYVAKSMEKSGGKGINPAELLFQFLESRLDNVIFRLGFAASRQMSRQMASHGHFTVNGKRVTIPSYNLSIGDKIGIREASTKKVLFANVDEKLKTAQIPSWLSLDLAKKIATIQGAPKLQGEVKLNFPAVIEFYSR